MRQNELCHYGVKGMKWGKRRYQNKDGSLTPAGRKRYQKDADRLSSVMKDHMDSTNDFQRSLKRVYLVDKDGNNRWGSDGKGYFDTSGGIIQTTDSRKVSKKNQNEQKYIQMKKLMQRKYNSVKVDAEYNIETGKAFSKVVLEKDGHKFVSEFEKDYGSFNTDSMIEFRKMFKDQ